MKKLLVFASGLFLIACHKQEKSCSRLSSELQGWKFSGQTWVCDSSGNLSLDTVNVLMAGYNPGGGYATFYRNSGNIDTIYSCEFVCDEDIDVTQLITILDDNTNTQLGFYNGAVDKLFLNVRFPDCDADIEYCGSQIH